MSEKKNAGLWPQNPTPLDAALAFEKIAIETEKFKQMKKEAQENPISKISKDFNLPANYFDILKSRIEKIKEKAIKNESERTKQFQNLNSELNSVICDLEAQRDTEKTQKVVTHTKGENEALTPVKTNVRKKEATQETKEKKENELFEVLDGFKNAMLKFWNIEVFLSPVNFRHAKNLISAVGYENAKLVAAYYPSRREKFYLQKGHDLRYAILDANKLLGEIQTGIKKTNAVINKLASDEETEAYNDRKELGLENEFWNDETPLLNNSIKGLLT